ncbi:unnamed protein product [Acanthoscelides obtectus]|uniref:Uncharacterized protein n=1 Tax=Acanthoscelides obtectus TaxID=200917 RepID=A0A9P0VRJ7_ACAOB|nr:unnamed protein product [Acanthoscelides obtectus]CAH2018197.1 unnamed protein product [Acanthoscelides obtectus]CAK1671869.1 hypothetical protein AOBTE_LOCUS28511 [Acanthoscelides obtectus]CAK1688000.1 hypothetical protein AOBTE_LOCUS36507 [Acanthoscelides obtectus]
MLWDCVNEISGKRNKKAEINKIKIESGEEISNKNDIAQKFLEHLTSIGEKLAEKIPRTAPIKQESSNAVRMGSLDESAINEGEANARYAFILLLECRRESSCLEVTHSSQPHLESRRSTLVKRFSDLHRGRRYLRSLLRLEAEGCFVIS